MYTTDLKLLDRTSYVQAADVYTVFFSKFQTITLEYLVQKGSPSPTTLLGGRSQEILYANGSTI